MCHQNRGPRCSSCHKPAPRHRCHCPAKYASAQAATIQHDGLPTYAAATDPQPPVSAPLPISVQSRWGAHSYGGCGYRKRQCRGPVHLLVGLVIRKVQEKKERKRLAADLSDETESEQQERGVVERMDEKQMEGGELKEEEQDKDVKVLTKSVRSMSL